MIFRNNVCNVVSIKNNMESDKRKFFKIWVFKLFLLCFVFGCNKQSKQFSEEGFNKTLLKKRTTAYFGRL